MAPSISIVIAAFLTPIFCVLAERAHRRGEYQKSLVYWFALFVIITINVFIHIESWTK